MICPSEPDGTVNVQPRARPRKLPRMRRGMYRPASTCSQAWPSASSASPVNCAAVALLTSISIRGSSGPIVSLLFSSLRGQRLDFDFPALRGGHPRAVGLDAHEAAGG